MRGILDFISTPINKAIAALLAVPIVPAVVEILVWLANSWGVAVPEGIEGAFFTVYEFLVALGIAAIVFFIPNKDNPKEEDQNE